MTGDGCIVTGDGCNMTGDGCNMTEYSCNKTGDGYNITGDGCNMTGGRYIFICTGFSMMGGACIVERKVTIKEMEEITTEPQGTQRGKPQPKRTRLALKLQITKYKLQNCRSN